MAKLAAALPPDQLAAVLAAMHKGSAPASAGSLSARVVPTEAPVATHVQREPESPRVVPTEAPVATHVHREPESPKAFVATQVKLEPESPVGVDDRHEQPQGEGEGPEGQAAKKVKRGKTACQTLHVDSYALATNFATLYTRAQTICDLAKREDSDWHWANAEAETLRTALTPVQEVLNTANSDVLTKRFDKLQADKGEATEKFLNTTKRDLDTAISTISSLLVPLSKMHASKYMPIVVKREKANKLAKAKAKAAIRME